MVFHFISIENEFYDTLYGDFDHTPNHLVRLPSNTGWSRFQHALHGWKLPFTWVRSKLLRFRFPSSDTLLTELNSSGVDDVFIIYGRILEFYGPGIVTFLRKCNPKAKFVCYLGDVVSTFTFNIDKVKKHFDLVFSCDRKDAEANGLLFLQEPYSKVNNEVLPIEYDFLFIGSEKGRIKKIHKIYEALTNRGFKCKFYIHGVKDDDQLFSGQIIYNQYLPYNEVIDLLRKSRCVIEVLQIDADTTTTRFSEALLYKKYLLTDSGYLRQSANIPPNIICFDYKDWSVLDRIYEPLNYDVSKYKNELSVETMIDGIKEKLNGF